MVSDTAQDVKIQMDKAQYDAAKHQLQRLTKSLTFRLQSIAIFLSVVGVAFGVKSFLHIRSEFGVTASAPFANDIYQQIGVAIIVNIIVGYAIYKVCTLPIKTLSLAMDKIVHGDLDEAIPYTKARNEIGHMAKRIEIFRQNAIEKHTLEQSQAEEQQRNEQEKKRMMIELADRFETSISEVVENLEQTTTTIDTTSSNLSKISAELDQRTANATDATQRTSENMQGISAATNQVNASIIHVTDKTSQSNTIVQNAVKEAEDANIRVLELSEAMTEISSITNLIQGIAEQTNLLALNATIEAARAGDAGKGFAVVASEVKTLANETAGATEQISNKIMRLMDETKAVVSVIQKLSKTMQDTQNISEDITKAVNDERQAVEDISGKVTDTQNVSETASENLYSVSDSTKQTGHIAQNMAEAVNLLKTQSHALHNSVEDFLQSVRT